MIQILLALISSLAGSVGGKTGALVIQLVNTVGLGIAGAADFKAFAGPWIQWANKIVDAKRDPTPAESAAANALADAVHANNQSLGSGGAGVPLPSPPPA
jgi:hypothetical protein